MYIILAIIIFGVLIAVHELGHFSAAKLMGVKVNEFAIGMGPKLLSKQRGETVYAWRLLPIGGSCVMEGEDEEVPDPRSFTAAPRWKRAVILVAGSLFNFAAGALIIAVLYANPTPQMLETNVIDWVASGSAYENVLLPGDKLVKLNGHRVFNREDFETFLGAPFSADGVMDLEVVRNGERIVFDDLALEGRVLPNRDGVVAPRLGLVMVRPEPSIFQSLRYMGIEIYNDVRMVGLSLQMLTQGQAGVRDLSGFVGIVQVIDTVGNTTVENEQGEQELAPLGLRLGRIAWFAALIAINLAVMNMLPIPALDGGRIAGLVITFCIEKIIRRRVNPKYEGYVHAAGLVLLLGLMVIVMVSDVMKVFQR